jgi:hypothetical protein
LLARRGVLSHCRQPVGHPCRAGMNAQPSLAPSAVAAGACWHPLSRPSMTTAPRRRQAWPALLRTTTRRTSQVARRRSHVAGRTSQVASRSRRSQVAVRGSRVAGRRGPRKR